MLTSCEYLLDRVNVYITGSRCDGASLKYFPLSLHSKASAFHSEDISSPYDFSSFDVNKVASEEAETPRFERQTAASAPASESPEVDPVKTGEYRPVSIPFEFPPFGATGIEEEEEEEVLSEEPPRKEFQHHTLQRPKLRKQEPEIT